MSKQNRTTLKSYFETGDQPTEQQFSDLIDSSLNQQDDDIFIDNKKLGLGHNNSAAKLAVNGGLYIGSDATVDPGANNLQVDGNVIAPGKVGIGAGFTNPTAQLAVNGGVYIGSDKTVDPGANNLQVAGNVIAPGKVGIGSGFTNHAAKLAVNGGVYIGSDKTVDPGNNNLKVKGDIDIGGDLKFKKNATDKKLIEWKSLHVTMRHGMVLNKSKRERLSYLPSEYFIVISGFDFSMVNKFSRQNISFLSVYPLIVKNHWYINVTLPVGITDLDYLDQGYDYVKVYYMAISRKLIDGDTDDAD